jgi:hypothetical protein
VLGIGWKHTLAAAIVVGALFTATTSPSGAAPVPTSRPPTPPWAAALQDVANYAAGRDGDLEVSVADLTTGAVLDAPTAQPPLETASIIKVAIAVTPLRQVEADGRDLTDAEMYALTYMIEVSSNDSASYLWDDVGGADGVQPTLDAVGMPQTALDEGSAWGATTTTADDQARLLLALRAGWLLNPDDTALVLDLMRHVDPSQRWGAADAAPDLDPAVKNGWFADADTWRVHCLAIFDQGLPHPFAISILTRYSVELGQEYGEDTCRDATSLVLVAATATLSPTALTWIEQGGSGASIGATRVRFGEVGDQVLACDWNGDGVDSPGLYRNGTFYLINGNTSPAGPEVLAFRYGDPGDEAICGDWNGDGVDTVGVHRGNTFYLSNVNGPVVADTTFVYGDPGDVPVVGDWDGSGTDRVGVRRGFTYYLSAANGPGVASAVVAFGNPGDQPVVGKWTGGAADTVGVYRSGVLYGRLSNTTGVADIVVGYGDPDDVLLAGRWAPGAPSLLAVVRGEG